MLFNSYIFLLFFLPLCLIGYFFLNKTGIRTIALLELIVMSLWFYGYFNYKYLLILCGSIFMNWIISRMLIKKSTIDHRIYLAVGIICNILLIFYFKYYDFFISNINEAFKLSFEMKNILLPLGISFFTFQQISYLVDSYRGETKDYKFLEYMTFVSFFPQLIAGPIVLHSEFIPQLRDKEKWQFNHTNFANGIYTLAVGLFKKIIIADTFGVAVSWAWENIDRLTSMEILVIMLCYTFQIYFDFSGYCDMVIGLGKMFNIKLPVNFNSPYKSYSIIEFWTRWHITLTRFLRNYIYFPMGGSKKGEIRTYTNILIVFLISGIWHGANWTFIIWGGIHGIANVINRIFHKLWDDCNVVFRWGCTFIFINVTWLIFRADDLRQAADLLKRLIVMDSLSISEELYACFRLKEFGLVELLEPWSFLVNSINGFYLWIFLIVAFVVCVNSENIHNKIFKPTKRKAISTIIMLVWTIMSFSGISTFLYFNF